MNISSRNYWSLYVEFLETFKHLKYKGFSVPYLCHFRSLLHDNAYVWENLPSEKFVNSLSHKVNDKQELQKKFSSYKQYHINKKSSKLSKKAHGKGKVVLYNAANLLRFPKEIIEEHFPSTQTVLLQDIKSNKKPKVIKGIPVEGVPSHYLSHYRANVSSNINILKGIADQIISKHTNHPMFNDPSFKPIFFKQLEGILNRIEEANRYFSKNPVSCIILASTHYYQSRTIAMVAAEVGIPTICMQHGIIGDEIGYMPQIADVDAVYGNFEVDWFKQIGITKPGVEVIGHPRFDTIRKNPSISKIEMEKQLGLKPGKKMILMIVRDEKQLEKWENLLSHLSNNGKYNIVIKDYPFLTPHQLTTKSPDAYSSNNFHLYDLIHHSDVVLTYLSTVGLEAMISNKPVFILSTTFPTYTGYFDSYGEFVQTDPLILSKMIKEYLENGKNKKLMELKRKEFLSYAYPSAKPSGQRLFDLIKRLEK